MQHWSPEEFNALLVFFNEEDQLYVLFPATINVGLFVQWQTIKIYASEEMEEIRKDSPGKVNIVKGNVEKMTDDEKGKSVEQPI